MVTAINEISAFVYRADRCESSWIIVFFFFKGPRAEEFSNFSLSRGVFHPRPKNPPPSGNSYFLGAFLLVSFCSCQSLHRRGNKLRRNTFAVTRKGSTRHPMEIHFSSIVLLSLFSPSLRRRCLLFLFFFFLLLFFVFYFFPSFSLSLSLSCSSLRPPEGRAPSRSSTRHGSSRGPLRRAINVISFSGYVAARRKPTREIFLRLRTTRHDPEGLPDRFSITNRAER